MRKCIVIIAVTSFIFFAFSNLTGASDSELLRESNIAKLRAEIMEILRDHQYTPEYLPGLGVKNQLLAILGTKKYDRLYYPALDLRGFGIRSLHFANIFLNQNDPIHATKYIKLGLRFFAYSDQLFSEAAEVWEGKIKRVSSKIKHVYDVSKFSSKGIGAVCGPASLILDGIYLLFDYGVDNALSGREIAWSNFKENLIITIATEVAYRVPISCLDGRTIKEVLSTKSEQIVGKMGKILDELIDNPETKEIILKTLEGYGIEIPKEIAEHKVKSIRHSRIASTRYNNLGVIYGQNGQYDKAITYFNKALELNPKDVYAYNNRGLAYAGKGNYRRAIIDYNIALSIDPRFAKAYYNRGAAYANMGQFDRAIKDFTSAIKINPKDGEAYQYRAISYYNKGNLPKSCLDAYKACDLGNCELLKSFQEKSICR